MPRSPPRTPDTEYLDAFLQGARFALFALQARLQKGEPIDAGEVEAVFDEFHLLFKDAREGMLERRPVLRLVTHDFRKN